MKRISKNLAEVIRDLTPFVPTGWVLFWVTDVPGNSEYKPVSCVLGFLLLTFFSAFLFALGETVASGREEFFRHSKDETISLFDQLFRLTALLIGLGFITYYILSRVR